MSGIGSGYDLSTDTYSPEGRVFQVEYASKALDSNGTTLGICCTDGVVVGVEKLLPSKMLEPHAVRRIFAIDKQCGMCISGMQPDGMVIVNRGRDECSSYRDYYMVPMTGALIAARIGEYMHTFTQYSGYRPFGCGILIASYSDDGPQLYFAEPSGTCHSYHGYAVGRAKTSAKAELEKLDFKSLTCRQAIQEVVRILSKVRTEEGCKEPPKYQIEIGWISTETNQTFSMIPPELMKEALAEIHANTPVVTSDTSTLPTNGISSPSS